MKILTVLDDFQKGDSLTARCTWQGASSFLSSGTQQTLYLTPLSVPPPPFMAPRFPSVATPPSPSRVASCLAIAKMIGALEQDAATQVVSRNSQTDI